MARYRITVQLIDNPADEPTKTVIECTTRNTLREDLAEWVNEEIDADADIVTVPDKEEWSQNMHVEFDNGEYADYYGVEFGKVYEFSSPYSAESVTLFLATE